MDYRTWGSDLTKSYNGTASLIVLIYGRLRLSALLGL
jgi:hypothetical protein